MSFQKSFDELLNGILTDYKNQFPEADTSQGSLIFIKSACLASALWGIYKYQDYISRQGFPDTADSENLEHHAFVRGLSRKAGESDADLLARLLEAIRRPPAGGNKYDYIRWAKEVTNVASAFCYPLAQGDGSVDVVILSDTTATDSEVPTSTARSATASAVTAGKLVDATANFTAGHAVAVGDVVRNNVSGLETVVTAVDSATQLSLQDDLFRFVGEEYEVYCQTGLTTAVAAGKLVDMNADFQNATYAIKKGDLVKNLSDGTQTTVVSVDSATQLTLADDRFTAIGKKYVIKGLIDQVKEYISGVRPVTVKLLRVLAPVNDPTNVTMSCSGTKWDKVAAAAEITAYLNALEPDETLYLAQLIAIAVGNGADNVVLTAPAANVVPASHHMIRPGVIDVT